MKNSNRVVLFKCTDYNAELIKEKITAGYNLLGFDIKKLEKKKILLKPNLLKAADYSKAVTTHPVFFDAVIEFIKPFAAEICYGDSPGIGKSSQVAKKSGLEAVAEKHSIKFCAFETKKTFHLDKYLFAKRFSIDPVIKNVDLIINLPKLKTHGMTFLTGALKNIYGVIPGLEKASLHFKISDESDFLKMLVDLNRLVKPDLTIMDGILAMEGNGPGAGTPYPLHVIIMGTNSVCVDTVAAALIGYRPEKIPMLQVAAESGLGTNNLSEIEILGDKLEPLVKNSFLKIRKVSNDVRIIPGQIGKIIKSVLIPVPVINKKKCTKCGDCIKICPVPGKALFRKNKNNIPKYDYYKCIRCYCCQEICPFEAISLKRSFFKGSLGKY